MSYIKVIVMALMCVFFQDSIEAAQVRAGLIYAARRGGHASRQEFRSRPRIGRCPLDPSLSITLEKNQPAENHEPVCAEARQRDLSFLKKLNQHFTTIKKLNAEFIKKNKKSIGSVFANSFSAYCAVKSNMEMDTFFDLHRAIRSHPHVYLMQSKIRFLKKK